MEKKGQTVKEIVEGLRNDGNDCGCHAWASVECGCDCNWAQHWVKAAGDMLEVLDKENMELKEQLARLKVRANWDHYSGLPSTSYYGTKE